MAGGCAALWQRQTLSGVACIALLALLGACSFSPAALWNREAETTVVVGGSAARGADALAAYGCGACHSIPGIAGANGMVGPPLDNWAERQIIVGSFPNQPQHLIRWIRFPQAVEPGNAMPDMGVSEQDARDISAYLYSLADD
jgi:cytochrome c1